MICPRCEVSWALSTVPCWSCGGAGADGNTGVLRASVVGTPNLTGWVAPHDPPPMELEDTP